VDHLAPYEHAPRLELLPLQQSRYGPRWLSLVLSLETNERSTNSQRKQTLTPGNTLYTPRIRPVVRGLPLQGPYSIKRTNGRKTLSIQSSIPAPRICFTGFSRAFIRCSRCGVTPFS